MDPMDELCPGMRLRYVSPTWGVQSLSRYELGEAIGEGTYGKVFKALENTTGRREKVALKMMVRHHEEEGFPKTETREIKILKSIRHPNMVNLREVVSSLGSAVESSKASTNRVVTPDKTAGEANPLGLYDRMGDIYMVFDYVDYDLAGLLDSQFVFSIHHVKSITYQLLQVLDYLHSHPQRFVHRDLKCANLLLTDDNILKLGDFGLARSLIQYDPAAKLSNTVITLWYRAPEVLLGSCEYTSAVDMWSVGCILVELLVGRPAFPARQESEQIKNICKVIGTPPEGSYLRSLPWWGKFEIEERKPQLLDWLQRHDRLRDPELLHLVSRLLEGDPHRRITAREALGAKWFASSPRIDRDAPNAGIPKISSAPGFIVGVDHHEYAAKQRRKAAEAAKANPPPPAAAPGPAPAQPMDELRNRVQQILNLTCTSAQEATTYLGHLEEMKASLGQALKDFQAVSGPSATDVIEEIQQHIFHLAGKVAELQAYLAGYVADSRSGTREPAPKPVGVGAGRARSRSRSRDMHRAKRSPSDDRRGRWREEHPKEGHRRDSLPTRTALLSRPDSRESRGDAADRYEEPRHFREPAGGRIAEVREGSNLDRRHSDSRDVRDLDRGRETEAGRHATTHRGGDSGIRESRREGDQHRDAGRERERYQDRVHEHDKRDREGDRDHRKDRERDHERHRGLAVDVDRDRSRGFSRDRHRDRDGGVDRAHDDRGRDADRVRDHDRDRDADRPRDRDYDRNFDRVRDRNRDGRDRDSARAHDMHRDSDDRRRERSRERRGYDRRDDRHDRRDDSRDRGRAHGRDR